MDMVAKWARDGFAEKICEILKAKTEEHPEATKALGGVGTEVLGLLLNTPEWTNGYRELFSQ